MKVLILVLFLFVGSSFQASTVTSPTYEAGVVEFNYVRDKDIPEETTTAESLRKYLEILQNAPATLDVIVFPEMTFNNMKTAVQIPEPAENIVPCDSVNFPAGNLVKEISCSAKTYQRYVVVNMVTKAECPDNEMIANKDPRNCTRDDGFSYYNTNVVFSRNGTVISRYRKFNLFGEDVDKPFKPAMATFETDFGVKFGHFICFDLMFQRPALELVRTENITNIIFPTMWYSELPFLTAVQAQQHWSYSHNVNLLASGANNPGYGSTGSGIYAGRKGSLTSVMEGKADWKLYTATVPKIGLGDSIQISQSSVRYTKEQMAPLTLKRDQLDRYAIRFFPDHKLTPETAISSTLCHEDFCCEFTYSFNTLTSTKPHYNFAMAVYHGNRTFDGFADGGVVACAVLACQTNDVATCGVRNETLDFIHQWYKLEISGVFPHGDQFAYFPTTLDLAIMPLDVNEYSYVQTAVSQEDNLNSTENRIRMTSVGDLRDEFYTFGIYGRDFNLDEVEDAAGFVQVSALLVTVLAILSTAWNLQYLNPCD